MSRQYNREIFTSNGITYICYTTDRPSGFTHHCEIMYLGTVFNEVKAYYYNRTWEQYRFQSVLRRAEDWVDNNLKLESFKRAY